MSLLSRGAGGAGGEKWLERITLISILAVAIAGGLYAQSAYLNRAWQLLALALGAALALGGGGVSLLLSRMRRPAAATGALLVSLVLWVGAMPVFMRGVAATAALAAALIVVIVGVGALPGRWRIWLTLGAACALLILAVDGVAPLGRYEPEPFSLPNLYLMSLNALGLGVVVWHIGVLALRPAESIRTRLVLTSVLLILFTGAAITYVNQIVMVRLEQRDAISHLSEIVAQANLDANTWADTLQGSLGLFEEHARPQLDVLLAAEPRDRDASLRALGHISEDIQEAAAQSRLFDEMAVLDRRGKVLISTRQQLDSWAALMPACLTAPTAGPCMQPPRYDQTFGTAIIVFVDPVLGADGTVRGFVAGRVPLNTLGERVMAISVGQMLAISLITGDSNAAAPPPAAYPRGSGFYSDSRGVAVVGVYRWLPSVQVGLLIEQEQSLAFRPEMLALDTHLLATLLLLALGVVIAMAVVRSITAPLKLLSEAAAQISAGALDVRAEVQRSDEIGALAQAFNRMAASLRQSHEQLEQRVQQRTEQLAQVNADLRAENVERQRAEQAVEFERNKLNSILDAMDDGVYIVNREYRIEYINPALERLFGPVGERRCYEYLYGRGATCADCPNEQVWQGQTVHREESLGNGRIYDTFDAPLESADGTRKKLAIFHDVTARRQAQGEIVRRNAELAVLSRRLVEIQESERQYIARELHDETGQALTSLMLRLGAVERGLAGEATAAAGVAAIKREVEEVLGSLHTLASDLRPSSLDHVGLVPALRQYTERMAERHGLLIDFEVIGLGERHLPTEMGITIYRIVQEALANVVRHAGATQVDVIVERRRDTVRVTIEDNGRGFDVQAGMFTGRLGLIGMRERAEMIGGSLVVDSALGGGAMILMEAPIDNAHPDR